MKNNLLDTGQVALNQYNILRFNSFYRTLKPQLQFSVKNLEGEGIYFFSFHEAYKDCPIV